MEEENGQGQFLPATRDSHAPPLQAVLMGASKIRPLFFVCFGPMEGRVEGGPNIQIWRELRIGVRSRVMY